MVSGGGSGGRRAGGAFDLHLLEGNVEALVPDKVVESWLTGCYSTARVVRRKPDVLLGALRRLP